MLFAVTESVTQIGAEFTYFRFRKAALRHQSCKTCEILHADIDIPANLVRIFVYFVIFDIYYI